MDIVTYKRFYVFLMLLIYEVTAVLSRPLCNHDQLMAGDPAVSKSQLGLLCFLLHSVPRLEEHFHHQLLLHAESDGGDV